MQVYDLTGTSFTRSKDVVLYANPQVVQFFEPVFYDTIVLKNAVTQDPIIFSANSTDVDQQATSEALLRDISFNRLLVKSITVAGNTGKISAVATYYGLTATPVEAAGAEPQGPTMTPSLAKALVDQVETLMSDRASAASLSTQSISAIRLLDVDVTGTSTDNLVLNERHNINVPGHRAFIRPQAGSFYNLSSLTITVVGSGIALTKGTDYVLVGNNIAKQMATVSTAGVYDYLLVLAAIDGDVDVTYQAFGGEVRQIDISEMRDGLLSILTLMKNTAFISQDSLPTAPPFAAMAARVQAMEAYLRQYPMMAIYLKPDDTAIHWYSFATLTGTPWSAVDAVTTDMAEFVIESLSQGWAYDVSIHMDTKLVDNQMRVRAINSTEEGTYSACLSYQMMVAPNPPKLRLVWVGNGVDSGSVLQIGLTLPAGQEEIVRITNKSGVQGKWLLDRTVDAFTRPGDLAIPMPMTGIWSPSGSGCKQCVRMVPSLEGTPVWIGNVNPTPFVSTVLPATLLSSIDVASVKGIEVVAYDRLNRRLIRARTTDIARTGGTSCTGFAWLYQRDMAGVDVTLASSGAASFRLFAGQRGVMATQFDIRHIQLIY